MATIIATAIFDYTAQDEGDLPFSKGETIEVLQRDGEWWYGKNKSGKAGLFPFNRVEVKPSVSDQLAATSLASRSASDVISDVKVEAEKISRKGFYKYTIKIFLQNGKQVVTQREMPDLRKFDKAVRLLDPQFHFRGRLPPEWADEIPVTDETAAARLEMIHDYFFNKKDADGRAVFDALILVWARIKKTDLRGSIGSDKVALTTFDNKQSVEDKCSKALIYIYQNTLDSPLDNFIGPNKKGMLCQAKHGWDAKDAKEVSFLAGELILVLRKETQYGGWFYGQRPDGPNGVFPSNYIKILKDSSIKRKLKVSKNPSTQDASGGFNTPPGSAGSSRRPPIQHTDTMISRNEQSPPMASFQDPGARERIIEKDFFIKSCEAYDELHEQGYTMEVNGKYQQMKKGSPNSPKNGSMVTLDFSAYVWDPQTQILREFSSSDKLKAPPKGVQSGQAGASGFQMEFVVGQNQVNDGLEEIVQLLSVGVKTRGIISPDKGYGEVGCPPEIPGNTYLVYDLTLKNITQGQGTQYPQPRRQVFSVGISRPSVQMRQADKDNGKRRKKRGATRKPEFDRRI